MTFREERVEKEDREDHKATLCYDLEKEMKQIFEQFTRKKQSMRTIGHFARGLWAIEQRYKREGLSWEEIEGVRRGIKGE
jgi:hypothetical protein